MGTQLFLILITLCATFIKKEEQLPALIYLLISFLFYFACNDMGHSHYFYLLAMITEAFLVVCLTCFKQTYSSKLVSKLIPLSYAAVFLDLFGFLCAIKGYPADMYNEGVNIYWAIIIMLFLSVGKWWDGSYVWVNSIFHHTDNNNNRV